MKTTLKTLIFLISINLSYGQITQSLSIPMQGKAINFDPQNSGNILSYSDLPIPSSANYPWLSSENLNSTTKAQYVEKIVTNEKGELLFFIKDHRIYDYRGISGDIDDSPYIFTESGGTEDPDTESPLIRELDIIPLDGDCYKYLLIWHEVTQAPLFPPGNGLEPNSAFYYQIVYVNADKTLSFEGDNEVPNEANLLLLNSGSTSEENSTPGGFGVTKTRADGTRLLFVHDYGYEYTFLINNNGLNTTPIYFSLYSEHPLGSTEGRMYWEESEVIQKNGNYYYVFASTGSHTAKIALIFIKYNSNGQKIFQTYKDVGYTYYNSQYVNEYVKGIEFSEDGNYLYFTQRGKSLQYLSTDFMSSQTTPGALNSISAIGTDYQYSHIELVRDKRFYLINGATSTLTAIANTNTPINLAITTNIGQANGISGLQINSNYTLISVPNNDCMKNYYISSQIDGSDYTSYYTNLPQECCSEHFYYNDDYMTSEAAPSGLTATWTASSNPFNSNGSAEVYLRDNLVLHNNTNITISGMTFYFKEGKGIILEAGDDNNNIKGAKLTLSNSFCTAYDGCGISDVLWQGITANGNDSDPYGSATTQTQVILNNYSTIEYAENGIKALNGAIVKAYLSNFINNRYGIYFNTFNNSYPDNIVSYVSKCTFTTDNTLYQAKQSNPLSFIKAYGYSNINFIGNIMRNLADNAVIGNVYNRGLGIKATNSKVHVKPKLNSRGLIEQKSTFYKLRHAIIFELGGSSSSTADNCVFDTNLDAFKVRGGADNCVVTKNEFKNIYNNDSGSNMESGGLYLEGVTGYTVEENVFHDGVAGMFVVNSGTDYNQIYKNRFYNLQNNSNYTALIATQENSDYAIITNGSHGDDGLDLICNKFENNDYAIAVIDGSVAKNQDGMNSSTGSTNIGPTGNWFDHCHLLSDNTDFYTENAVCDIYQYTQHGKFGTPNELKLDFGINKYFDNLLINVVIDPYADNVYDTYCPSHTDTDPIFNPRDGLLSTMSFADGAKTAESIESEELSVLDLEANSEIMETKVNSATNSNFAEVSEELSDNTGYLKEEVLLDYIKNDIDMPVEKTVTLLANSPLPSQAKQGLQQANLPQNYIDYIALYQNGTYPREAKEKAISAHKARYQHLTNKMVFAALNDSIGGKKDSLIEWLSAKDDRFSRETMIKLLAQNHQFDEALQLIDNVKAEVSVNNSDDWVLIRKASVLNAKDNNEFMAFVSTNQADLEAMASLAYGKDNSLARAYLNFAGLGDYKEQYPLPNPQNRAANFEQNNSKQASNKASISVYPNPANSEVKVAFFSLTGSKTLSVYNLNGQLIKQIPTENSFGFVTLNVSDMPNGTYLISPDDMGNSVKLIVQH